MRGSQARALGCVCLHAVGRVPPCVVAQVRPALPVDSTESIPAAVSPEVRARRFLAGRTAVDSSSAAQAIDQARTQHAALLLQQALSPRITSLDTAWLPLSGPGVDFTLATNGPSSVTTTNGQNAVFPLRFTSGPAVAGATVSLTCSGAPANSTCKVAPTSVAVDGNATTVSVTVLTGVTGAASVSVAQSRILWATMLAPFGLLVVRRKRLAAAAVLCVLLVASGCGSGRLIPSAGSPGSGGGSGAGTPAGSYNIVVTATGAGLARTVNLTLVVQ